MDADTLRALKDSIRHWEENVAAVTPHDAKIYADDCPLCDMFYRKKGCAGCPVEAVTGLPDCGSTPWSKVRTAFENWVPHPEHIGYRAMFRQRAADELNFLRALVPAGSDP